MRTVDEILAGSAIVWVNLTPEELRVEHEQLRRALETSRAQVSALIARQALRQREED